MENKKRSRKAQKVKESDIKLDRRQFLKVGSAGAALAGLAVTKISSHALAETAAKEMVKNIVTEHNGFPVPVSKDYRPPTNYDCVFGPSFFGDYLRAAGKTVDERAYKAGKAFIQGYNYHHDNNEIGMDQLSKAVLAAVWAISNECAGPSPGAISDYGVMNWVQPADKPSYALMDHNFVQKKQYKFESKAEAVAAIKRAARLYGADLVGITRRDKRWDYREFFNPVPPPGRMMFPPPPSPKSLPQLMELIKTWGPDKFFHGWERFPFEPKTVVVLGFEMDYESAAASPYMLGEASAGAGYSQMAKTAYQLSVFFKQLGYHAVACGNDTGLSVPYAIAAGLGEASRSGMMITYKYGPRVRLAKVYTDFDFVEYDKPKTFGVMDFCKNCVRCADACPAEAISKDPEPSFKPTHEEKENPWFNAVGTYKWYVNCLKCHEFWGKNKGACGNCITSCPYNKPDFWHHRVVRKIGKVDVSTLHVIMREIDIIFGYGNTNDEKAVARFFENHSGRDYSGGL